MYANSTSVEKYKNHFEDLSFKHEKDRPLLSKQMLLLLEQLDGLTQAVNKTISFFEGFFATLEIDSRLQLLEFYIEETDLYMSEYEILNTIEEEYRTYYREVTEIYYPISLIYGLSNRNNRTD